MKQFAIYIFALVIAISMVSCIYDDVELNSVEQEGCPVTLNLSFVSMATDEQNISTRGGDNHDINDLYILIFSSDNGRPGTLKDKLYTTDLIKENISISNDNGTSSASTSTKVTAPINTTTGESFIFAFGNISQTNAPAEYDVSSLMEELDALPIGSNCFDDLMNISIPLQTTHITSLQRVTDLYLMAGMYQKDGTYTRELTPCMINASGNISGGSIRMYRLDARIDFNIKSDLSSDSNGTFIPTSWRIYNIPIKSRLMTTGYDSGEDFDGKSPIYTTDASVAENYWNTPDMIINSEENGYRFSFYMFENRKSPTEAGQNLSKWEYRHREIMNPLSNTDGTPSTEGNKHSFAYAPKYATYVELDGYFTGSTDYPFGSSVKDGNQHPITATTQYRIHLGDFGSNVDNQGHTLNDFNTLRNYHYTYNITIKGVDQIIVEVIKDGEDLQDLETPGVNGLVSYIPANSHRVDSHFETRSIRIKKSDLANWDEDDFKYLAQTCYGDYQGSKGDDSPQHDIYWIEFALTHKQKKDGSWWSWHTGTGTSYSSVPTAGRTSQHPAYISYQHATSLSKNSSEVKLMYVNEFLQSLWEWKNAPDNSSDNIHGNIQEKIFTVFIKENYYSHEDIQKFTRQKNNSSTSDATHWKDFCNQPDRMMYIGMNTIASNETESAIMENVCLIRQRSIQTIYNTNQAHTGLTSAWGIETVDEMYGTVTQFDVSNGVARTQKDAAGAGTDFDTTENLYYNHNNGYPAQYFFLWQGWRMYTSGTAESKPETLWSRYVNQHTHDDMTSSRYYHAYFECLSRNRDVDGDGFLDPSELRWYLPAVNQFGALFIGERGIDPEATMHYEITRWDDDYPYLSSTLAADNYSQLKIISVEGFAYSSIEGAYGAYEIRCARNMGVNDDTNYKEGFYYSPRIMLSMDKLRENFDEPQDYVQVNQAERTMDLTYLNDKSKRGYVSIELSAEHTEHSDENQLFKKFQWADGLAWASHSYTQNGTTYYNLFSGDEVAYGERNNNTMRTMTRASLYPKDLKNTVQSANDYPRLGWRAPNQKELMLLHFHANGFRAGTSHTCTNADGGSHVGYSGDSWFFCRTCFSFGGMKANRSWRSWPSNWVTDASSIVDNSGNPINNAGNWYRYDNTNESLTPTPGRQYYDYRYTYGIQHNGTGFGLLYMDWQMDGNPNSKQCYLVPVRDLK